MKKLILLVAVILLVYPAQTLALIAPPTTSIECKINEEVLYHNACLNEDCSIKAFDETPLSEGDCGDADCTNTVTKEEAEKARLYHPYRIGYKSENYYMGYGGVHEGKIILMSETEFPNLEVINKICKEDLTIIKEWLAGRTSSSYITITSYNSELQRELDYYETQMKKREDFKDKQIYSIEQKGTWAKINYLATFEIHKNPQQYSRTAPIPFLMIGILVIILLLGIISSYIYTKKKTNK